MFQLLDLATQIDFLPSEVMSYDLEQLLTWLSLYGEIQDTHQSLVDNEVNFWLFYFRTWCGTEHTIMCGDDGSIQFYRYHIGQRIWIRRA